MENFIKDNKKQFYGWIIILAVVLVIGIGISIALGNSSSKQKTKNIDKVEIKQDQIPEINTLVSEYYAAVITGDMEKLSTLLDDMGDLTADQVKQSVIESYNNISCYVADGLEKDTYVVFTYWEVKFANIDTLAPGINTFYLIKKDGKYLIKNDMSDGEESYINTLSKNKTISKLFEDTNQKFTDAVNSDERLKAIYDYLNESTSQTETSQEETTK